MLLLSVTDGNALSHTYIFSKWLAQEGLMIFPGIALGINLQEANFVLIF